MNPLLIRRRGMMQASSGGGGGGYVMDGLVLHLDGIDKGASAGNWTSLVGGYIFENHGAVLNADHVYFNGSSWLQNTGNITIASADATIEVVYDKEVLTGVVYMPRYGSIAFGFSNGSVAWSCDNIGRPTYPVTGIKGSFSVSLLGAYLNGTAIPSGSANQWGNSGNYNSIGRRPYPNPTPIYYKGKIYSIRIYNRQLSQAEVLQNFAEDNSRFNLGI